MPFRIHSRGRLLPWVLLALGCGCGGGGGGGGGPPAGPTAGLASLVLDAASLAPAFAPGTLTYSASAGHLTPQLAITPTSVNPAATIQLDGQPVPSGVASTVDLAEGLTTVGLVVVELDGLTQTAYTLSVTRAQLISLAQSLAAPTPRALDWFGSSVACDGTTMLVGATQEDSSAIGVNGSEGPAALEDSGAAYVFVRTGSTWASQAYIKASNPGAGDHFGGAVALSGDTIAVSAYSEDSSAVGVNGSQVNNGATDSGAVYIFVRSGGTWTQQAYIKASNTDPNDNFGVAVALHGDTLAVGAWNERSLSTGVNGDQSDNSAALTGNGAGAVYVFARSGTTWTQQSYLKASNADAGDGFGNCVALHGDTLAVGAPMESGGAQGIGGDESDDSAGASGAVYVFERTGSTWTQSAYIKASNAAAGDVFGVRVALSLDTLIVGAVGEGSAATGVDGDQSDNSAPGSGAAYVFVRSGASWAQQAYIKAVNLCREFGATLALHGDLLCVGAPAENGASSGVDADWSFFGLHGSGAVYVYARTGGTWAFRSYIKSDSPVQDGQFGDSLALWRGGLACAAVREGGQTGLCHVYR